MSKRILSLVLAMLLVILALPASFAEGEKKELTVAVKVSRFDMGDNFADKPFVKILEERTGVHVNWVEIPEAAYNEKMATLLAGDLPDVFVLGMSDELVRDNAGLFVPIQDLIEENCPNLLKKYDETMDGWRSYLTYPDGNIYSLMSWYGENEINSCGGLPQINTEWLARVGKEMPTTAEELYDVLVAFKEQDANGNGDPNDEIPMDFSNAYGYSHILNMASMWGLPIINTVLYSVEGDEVKPVVNTQAYREFLEYFSKLRAEGLLNIEGFSQSYEQLTANLKAGIVGFVPHFSVYSVLEGDIPKAYTHVVPLAAEGYEMSLYREKAISARRNGFVITTACEDPELALQWWEAWSEDDLALLTARFEEGCWWYYAEDGYTRIGKDATKEEVAAYGYDLDVIGGIGTLMYGNYHPFVHQNHIGDISDPYSYNGSRILAVRAAKPYYSGVMTQQIVDTEDAEELAFATDGLSNYIMAYLADSILHGVTDESWDAYVAGLEDYGHSFMIEWYNRKLNGEI